MSTSRLTIMYRADISKDRVCVLIGADDASIISWDDPFAERNALRAAVEEARRTAGFWKDEHLAGNRVIDQQRAEVADLKARLLEAERGNEELVRLRAEKRECERLLRDVCSDLARHENADVRMVTCIELNNWMAEKEARENTN